MRYQIENLFSAEEKLTTAEVDAILASLHDAHGGANIVYCDNPRDPPVLSKVYRSGVELSQGNPLYDEKRLILSAFPAQDSINIAKDTHLAQYSVGNMCSPELRMFAPTYEKGSSAYLALNRYPDDGQTFMGIVQADPLWDHKVQRNKLIQCMRDAVTLYSGDKRRSNTSHPHMGYQFFFGHHKAYRENASIYVTRKPGSGGEDVSLLFSLNSYVYY